MYQVKTRNGMKWKSMDKCTVKFEQLNLYALAAIYLGCYKEDGTIWESDKVLHAKIEKYVLEDRKDGQFWYAMLDMLAKMKEVYKSK